MGSTEHEIDLRQQSKSEGAAHARAHSPSPAPATAHPLLALQQQAGNQAVQQMLRSGLLQAKLTVSNPGDPEEQEADQVADHVMRAHAGFPVTAPCSCTAGDESCEACRQTSAMIQRRADGNGARTDGLAVNANAATLVGAVLGRGGDPLPTEIAGFFGPRLGANFSDVRIHTGQEAAQSARSVNAHAYTTGNHIVFAQGRFQPSSQEGKTLLGHELVHVTQQNRAQSSAPSLARDTAPTTCPKTYTKAGNFKDLIDLVRAAEAKFNAAGVTSVDQQIKSLRAIYYGQTYSLDYTVEKSAVRNLGFETYTHSLTGGPKDPRSILDCGLFAALQASQDVSDGSRKIDFGHLIIAMDARESAFDRIPFPSGGTGTEVVTWLGDLGGGAGILADLRASSPSVSVRSSFSGTDYGAPSNLEGDVAGFLVGATSGATSVSAPNIPAGKQLSDVLNDYLSPGRAGTAWASRAKDFLTIYGGTFDASGNLTNESTLMANFASKIKTFACQYLASRVADGKITQAQLQGAADHVNPCSEEVAEAFLHALEDSIKTGGPIQTLRYPTPKPAKPGACSVVTTGAAAVKKIGELGQQAEQWWQGAHIPNPFSK